MTPPEPPPYPPPGPAAAQPPGAQHPDAELLQCRYCGSIPAAQVSYRAHRGMLVIMQFRRIDGPFCRNCGLDAFRTMTADTLLQGWWGPLSFFITPVTVLINVMCRNTAARLAPQRPAPYGYSRPSDPGKPLFARPQAVISLLLAFLLLAGLLLAH